MQLRNPTAMLSLSRRAFSTSSPRALARMQLIGRLGDAPEAVPTASGRDLIRYNLGVAHGRPDENGKRQMSWYRVASFPENEGRKNFLLNLPKGTSLFVEADAKMDSFETTEGDRRFALNLVARNFEILTRPRNNTGAESSEMESSEAEGA